MREDAPQRHHAWRDLFDAVCRMVKVGGPWRLLPGDFPPSTAVKQQARRWMQAGSFGEMTHDLRAILRLRLLREREQNPSAATLDGRKLQTN